MTVKEVFKDAGDAFLRRGAFAPPLFASDSVVDTLQGISSCHDLLVDLFTDASLLDFKQPNQVANTLLRGMLIKAQTTIETMCPDAVCSLQQRVSDTELQPMFVDNIPERFRRLVDDVKSYGVDSSYAGIALKQSRIVFIPRLRQEPDQSYPEALLEKLHTAGVRGTTVCPIRVRRGENGMEKLETVLVLQVDAFVEDGLIDNPTNRSLLTLLTKPFEMGLQLALSFQASLTRQSQQD